MDLHLCPTRLLQRACALLLVAAAPAGLAGCASLLGIDELGRAPDAGAVDGSVVPAPVAGPPGDGGVLPSGEIAWVRSLGNMGAYSIARHPSGALVIAGSAAETVDLGGGPLMPLGGADLVLAELDASTAEHVWSTSFGDVGSEYAFLGEAPFDGAGDVFVHGVTYDTANVGAGSVAGAGLADTYVSRYPRGGGPPAWIQRIATAEEDKFLATASGPGDSVFVTGYFVRSAALGSTMLTCNGDRDILLYRLAAADGQVLQARSWGGPGLDEGHGIVWTGSEIVLSGRFEQSFAFDAAGAGVVTSQGGRDLYVAKLLPDDTLAWARSFGGRGNEDGAARVDPAGNIYIYGSFEGEMVVDDFILASAGAQDIFLAKLDPAGNVLWARSWGSPGADTSVDLELAADGTIAITGWVSGDIDLDDGLVPGQGGIDTFVASYEPTAGAHRWSHVFGTAGDDRAWGVLVDGGMVYTLVDTATPLAWSPKPSGPAVDPRTVLLAIAR